MFEGQNLVVNRYSPQLVYKVVDQANTTANDLFDIVLVWHPDGIVTSAKSYTVGISSYSKFNVRTFLKH
ncbi:MAG: hypothetical protein GY927_17050 [bacterium]|nr:hypothetical protein [bacterium]